MVTISCSCGAVTTSRRNPMAGLPLAERLEQVRTAWSAHDGFVALELDDSWHPGGEARTGCLVLVDMDALDVVAGLGDQEAEGIAALLRLAHVRGMVLPAPVEVGPVRFRVTPADDFTGAVTYLVHEGATTLLELTCAYGGRGELASLVELYRAHGAPAVVQVDGLAPRIGLGAAVAGVRRARTASVA